MVKRDLVEMSKMTSRPWRPKSSIRITGVYGKKRAAVNVPVGATVGEVKERLQDKFNIWIDELVKEDKKVLVLSYAGSDLEDDWVFTDLGIVPGSTLRVCMKAEVKPVLFVKCSHNDELIEIMDDYFVEKMKVDDLKTIVAKKSGIPVSVFRLISRFNVELLNHHILFDYNVECGDTVYMEIWEGWCDFINDCIRGKTKMVKKSLADDEVQARFQMKVAMYIGAHFGCIELVNWCMKCDIRPDEPIGEHPARQWCVDQSHIEIMRSPVHEAAEFGQLQVLTNFFDENKNNTWLMARDGHDLTPLNLALRNHQKACAQFLLTKQWSRVKVANKSMSLQLVRRITLWCDRSKEKAYMKYGPSKSSLKRRTFSTGPLVTHGVIVDGYPDSMDNDHAKPKLRPFMRQSQKQISEETKLANQLNTFDPRIYFKNLNASQSSAMLKSARSSINADSSVSPRLSRMGSQVEFRNSARFVPKLSESAEVEEECKDTGTPNSNGNKEQNKANNKGTGLQQVQTNGLVSPKRQPGDSRKTSIDKSKNIQACGKKLRPATAIEPGAANVNGRENKSGRESVPGQKGRRTNRVVSALPTVGRRRRHVVREDDEALPHGDAEYNLRPFFYYNGDRADALSPLVDTVDQFYDVNAKTRATKSLQIATTFKEKPFLMRMQMAMCVSPSSLRREVSNLEHSFGPGKYYKRRKSRSAVVRSNPVITINDGVETQADIFAGFDSADQTDAPSKDDPRVDNDDKPASRENMEIRRRSSSLRRGRIRTPDLDQDIKIPVAELSKTYGEETMDAYVPNETLS